MNTVTLRLKVVTLNNKSDLEVKDGDLDTKTVTLRYNNCDLET